MDHEALGRHLRAARERRGLSQQAAADAIGLPRTAVTLVESGQRQVSTIELTKFATLYRGSIAEFLSTEEPVTEDYLVVLHRLAPEVEGDSAVKAAVEICLDLCKLAVELEGVLGREARQGPPNFAVPTPRSAGEAVIQGSDVAASERQRLGLGHAPIRNIAARITEQGVWAVTSRLMTDMSGFFMHDPAIGMVVIANRSHPIPRRRFSFAHEYGHALMDRDRQVQITSMSNANDLIEKRANAFAAAFLLPADGVELFLSGTGKGRASRQQQTFYDVASNGRFDVENRSAPNSQKITYQDVALLATNYGASYDATCYRLSNLKYIDRTELQELLTKSSLGRAYIDLFQTSGSHTASDRGANEAPEDPELRTQVLHLAMEAFRREEISRGRLLEIGKRLDIPLDRLLELADSGRDG